LIIIGYWAGNQKKYGGSEDVPGYLDDLQFMRYEDLQQLVLFMIHHKRITLVARDRLEQICDGYISDAFKDLEDKNDF
jgi:hypothetical protein